MKIYFLISFFSFPIMSMEKITAEYPELKNFFESSQLKSVIGNCEFEARSAQNRTDIAAMGMENNNNGIRKIIRINSNYIDKQKLSAEEIKSIICHELGHLNDQDMITKFLLPVISVFLVHGIFLGFIAKSLIEKKWKSACKRSGLFSLFYFTSKLVLAKLSRDRETFADEYGVRFTGNKEAAISALEKRRLFFKKTVYNFEILNKLRNLFQGHPTEEARIRHINSLIL